MSLDTHHNSEKVERQPQAQESEYYVHVTIEQNGKSNFSNQNTDNSHRSPKTPYEQRKPQVNKGFNGLSKKDETKIEQSTYQLSIDNDSVYHLKWLIFTVDTNTSDEILITALKNYKLIQDKIEYYLKKIYNNFDYQSFFTVTGIRERISFGKDIPCLDVNALCASKNKDGNEVLTDSIIKALVHQIEESVNENLGLKEPNTIKIKCFSQLVPAYIKDYLHMANYLKNQVSLSILKHFQQSEYAELLPKSYVYIPKSLKDKLTKITLKLPNTNVTEVRGILENDYSNQVTILDREQLEYKCTVLLNHPETRDEFAEELQGRFPNSQ